MPRKPRLIVENGVYHVISRGISEIEIFKEDNDYIYFLKILEVESKKYLIDIFSYCLMKTHYHMLLKIKQPTLSNFIQVINTKYAKYYNLKYFRIGNLFIHRFKSYLINDENYLLNVSRYIHLNPVEANIVIDPEDYRWSSYSSIIKKKNNSLINLEEFLNSISISIDNYKEYIYEILNLYKKQEHNIIENDENKKYILNLINNLGEKMFENKVLRNLLIYYLTDRKFSLDEISKLFNISKTQLSRINLKVETELQNNPDYIKYYYNLLKIIPLYEE